jgi:predicted DNA-binding WGR domain protein
VKYATQRIKQHLDRATRRARDHHIDRHSRQKAAGTHLRGQPDDYTKLRGLACPRWARIGPDGQDVTRNLVRNPGEARRQKQAHRLTRHKRARQPVGQVGDDPKRGLRHKPKHGFAWPQQYAGPRGDVLHDACFGRMQGQPHNPVAQGGQARACGRKLRLRYGKRFGGKTLSIGTHADMGCLEFG